MNIRIKPSTYGVLKIFLLLTIQCYSIFSIQGQNWNSINLNTWNNLTGVDFANDSVGFISGESGTLFKTVDSGSTWVDVFNLSNIHLKTVHCIDQDTVYVGGESKLYKSTDGGVTWTDLMQNSDITRVYFVTPKHGYYFKRIGVFCASSTNPNGSYWYYFDLYETNNYGKSWNRTNVNPSFRKDDIQFTSDSVGYLITSTIRQPWPHCGLDFGVTYYKTVNAGANWQTANRNSNKWYDNGFFIDDTNGFYLADGEIVQTNDGGISANRTRSNSYSISNNNSPFRQNISNFSFIDQHQGYFLSRNKIYKSSTQGVIWTNDFTATENLNTAYYQPNGMSYIVGDSGTVLRKNTPVQLLNDSIYLVSIDSNNLNFDTVSVGLEKMLLLNIANLGNMSLDLSVSSSSVFPMKLEGASGFDTLINSFTLPPLYDTTIEIVFQPTSNSLFIDSLHIYSTLANVNRYGVELKGVGSSNLIGEINDSLTVCADTVWLVGDVKVNEGATLTICPGTVISSKGPFQLEVYGQIRALGLKNDSIHFTSTTSSWKGIKFRNMSNSDSSVFMYCSVNKSSEYGIEASNPLSSIFNLSYSNLSIQHCNIHANGGGIYASNSLYICIDKSSIHDNSSENGAGICLVNSTAQITKNLVYNNRSSRDGGGIRIASAYDRIASNINQNVIFNNTASLKGGGIACDRSSPKIFNNTICNNDASQGSELACFGGNVASNPNVVNSILFGTDSNQIYIQSRWWPISNPSFSYCNIQSTKDQYDNTTNTNHQPIFIQPTLTKGQTDTPYGFNWDLKPQSPCINSGLLNNAVDSFDIRGYRRIIGDTIDVGAYESKAKSSDFNASCSIDSLQLTTYPLTVEVPTFQWAFNNVPIPNETSSSFTIDPFYLSNNGFYSCNLFYQNDTVIGFYSYIQVDSIKPIISSQSDTIQPIQLGDSVRLVVNSDFGNTHEWYLDNQLIPLETGNTFIISSANLADTGTYHCIVLNGCGQTRAKPIRVSLTVGLAENSKIETVELFPNPVQNELFIRSKSTNLERLDIIDVNGKIVSTLHHIQNKVTISHLKAGFYLFKFQTNQGVLLKKVIKQ